MSSHIYLFGDSCMLIHVLDSESNNGTMRTHYNNYFHESKNYKKILFFEL